MGIYLRKSFKFGPFRINLSKSGMGISAGVKGARISKGPRCTFVHMGRNGIYYRKSLTSLDKSTSVNSNVTHNNNNTNIQTTNIKLENIETENINNLVDSEFEEEFNEIKKKFSAGFFGDKKIYLFYNLDEEKEEKMSKFYDSISLLQKCNKAWWLYSQAKTDDDNKRNFGGADVVNKPVPLPPLYVVKYGIPKRFKTNLKVPIIELGKKIFFFPDRIFITSGKNIGTVNYKDLILEYGKMHQVFQTDPPKDSKIIKHVWQYANKDGSPDNRHSDNKQLPVYEIGQINFKSETGLNESVLFSNPEAVEKFVKSLQEYANDI